MEDRLSFGIGACHKLGQGDYFRSLHELSKSASVGEGQDRTKAFPEFLRIWTDLNLPQIAALRKPFYVWHALPRT
jgi:hypothetical protein